MSWLFRPTFKDNKELVNHLVKKGIIRTKSVISAMSKVDRKDFAPSDPYNDSPQYLGHGATISAPHMHGYALEYLQSKLLPGNKVLDIGSGSGVLCAYMAHMVLEEDTASLDTNTNNNNNTNSKDEEKVDSNKKKAMNGKVVGIEHIQELVEMSVENLNKSKQHKNWLLSGDMIILKEDGRKGYPKYAPYDCIHVGAAAQPNVVNTLFNQLKDGGILVIPVEVDSKTQHQIFRIYEKNNKYKDEKTGNYNVEKCCKDVLDVMYVPLTDAKKQKNRF